MAARKIVVKVLIIEDNELMRRLLHNVVAALAEDVFECEDGAQALTAYIAHRPDWVLMDLQMPRLDGIAATRQIRADFPKAKVVMVTDYDDAKFRLAAAEAGACAFVLKENLLELRALLRLSGE